MVWLDGVVEIKDKLRPDKYDRLRRGNGKSGYPASYPAFESIAKDDVPTNTSDLRERREWCLATWLSWIVLCLHRSGGG